MEKVLADMHIYQVASTILYSVIGIIIFGMAYAIIEKITPFSVKKEISQDHNVALGIIIGAVMIGLAIIISAAIQ